MGADTGHGRNPCCGRGYRSPWFSLWFSLWGAVAVFGVCVGFLVWPAATVIMFFTVPAVLAGLGTVVTYRANRSQTPGQSLTRLVGKYSVAVGAGTLAISVFATVLGALPWMSLLVLAAATSPWTVNAVQRQLAGDRPAARPGPGGNGSSGDDVAPVPASALPPAIRALTDKELCVAWRVSFTALESAGSAAARQGVVSLRQEYLDEIERRNPSGLRAWLASGPNAATSPDRYLSSPGGEAQRKDDAA